MPDLRPDNLTTAGTAAGNPLAAPPPWLRERLDWFGSLKFGLFVHWGLYAEWGCTESWPLVPAEPWARDAQLPAWVDCDGDLPRFQAAYRALNRAFNPRTFDPDTWVAAAQSAGMRYFNFTTKHHDGFCLFDTATTEYRTTHPSCPFHTHPHADVVRALFDGFRAAGFGLSCYFSKADWHCPDYWTPDAPAAQRGPNYDPRQHPERWRRFVDFTHRQIGELMSAYGPLDVLWLDGGWVRPPEQDIEMDHLVAAARRCQPGLIVVDRTVGGPHEDVLTPEQQVPDAPLERLWETCLTLGTSFSYKPNDEYKSVRQVIALLADIVSKGGNLLLGIGADKHGGLPPEALERLQGVGHWLAIHGEAIYGTRANTPFRQSAPELEIRYTRAGDVLYAILLAQPMQQRPPARCLLRDVQPAARSAIELLGVAEPVTWEATAAGALVHIPTAQLEHEPARPAWVLKLHVPR